MRWFGSAIYVCHFEMGFIVILVQYSSLIVIVVHCMVGLLSVIRNVERHCELSFFCELVRNMFVQNLCFMKSRLEFTFSLRLF